MLHSLLRTRSLHRFIALAVLAAAFVAAFAEDKQARKASAAPDNHKAPEGFTAIFNGKDLTGWHGRQGDFDHYVLEAMPGDKAVKDTEGDSVARTGTLTFAPGETTKTITIEVKGDSKKEADETFSLDLFGNSGNALLIDGWGIGTILNDD